MSLDLLDLLPADQGIEDALEASLCRTSFWRFVQTFWECVPGAGTMTANWHMELLCDELQEAAERAFAGQPREHDVAVNVPFGTSKSTIISILFPAWCWARRPDMRFIQGTHTHSLVLDFSYKTRQVLASERYRACFPGVRINRDGGDIYSNAAGGEVRTCTVGGKTPMGFHAHFILIDDPIDPQGVRSEAELETAEKFITQVIPSRMVNKTVTLTVLVMQRLHHRDPTWVMLETAKKDGATPVRHLCLPGELSDPADVNPPLEWLRARYGNRVYGEDGLMDARRLPRRELRRYLAVLGAYGYAGQILQKPSPPGGAMFKAPWFNQRVKAAPYHARRIRAWDRASTQDGGCYTAGVLLATSPDGNWYVEHVVHGQWEPDERNQQIKAAALRDRARYGPKHAPLILVESEGGATAKDANKALARLLAGFNIQFENVTGSKDERAGPWSSQLAALNVYLVEDGTWDVAGFVQEHLLFRPEPGKRLGKWKDQVDAAAMGFTRLVGGGGRQLLKTVSIGERKGGLHLIACSHASLAAILVEVPAVLIEFADPVAADDNNNSPPHGLSHLLGRLRLEFLDRDPAQMQEGWEVNPDKEFLFSREHGKKLWAWLLRQNNPPPKVIVFASPEGKRAESVACAACDVLGQPRVAIWKPHDPDGGECKGKGPNEYLFDQVKASRHLVV